MYMTKIQISQKNRQMLKSLSNVNQIHQWLAEAFQESQRMLWRIESTAEPITIITVSNGKPLESVLCKYAETIKTINYDNFLNSLKASKMYQFRLVANPTIKKSRGTGHQGQVVPLKQDQYLPWLESRQNTGFKVITALVTGDQTLRVKHRKNFMTIRQVKFSGALQVTNINEIKHILTHGIGREKAFGMGLLTLAPIN